MRLKATAGRQATFTVRGVFAAPAVRGIPAVRGALGALAALAVLAALTLPSAAAAEALLPPGNSAVDQYTESYPTANGDRGTRDPNGGGDRTPEQVLGQATGLSSSSGTSILLPLAILATILWSLAYLWRRRLAA